MERRQMEGGGRRSAPPVVGEAPRARRRCQHHHCLHSAALKAMKCDQQVRRDTDWGWVTLSLEGEISLLNHLCSCCRVCWRFGDRKLWWVIWVNTWVLKKLNLALKQTRSARTSRASQLLERNKRILTTSCESRTTQYQTSNLWQRHLQNKKKKSITAHKNFG